MMMNKRLEQQIHFIYTLERMKAVYRKSRLIHADRFENDAEHSFHIATMALLLKEYAPPEVDISRVVAMLLFHDVVEIEAGDTFAYDEKHNETKREREVLAAKKLYGSLPEEQGKAFSALWEEFEAQKTPESQFALAMDRMEPILLNVKSDGGTWKEYGVRYEDVLKRIEPIRAYGALYEVVKEKVDRFFEEVPNDEDFTR